VSFECSSKSVDFFQPLNRQKIESGNDLFFILQKPKKDLPVD